MLRKEIIEVRKKQARKLVWKFDCLAKVEDKIGNPLSPYAVTKLANELYANFQSLNSHTVTNKFVGPREYPCGQKIYETITLV